MYRKNGWFLCIALLTGLSLFLQGTPAQGTEDLPSQQTSLLMYPANRNFEGVKIGSPPAQLFTIKNIGDMEATLGTVMMTEEDLTPCEEKGCPQIDPQSFVIRRDNCSGQTLVPEEVCFVEVAFLPVSEGSRAAHLYVPIDAPKSSHLRALLIGNTPPVVEGEDSEIVVSLMPNQLIDLRCKAEPGRKIWVLINLPSIDPDFWFIRPSDNRCIRTGHCISVFSQYGELAPDAENLYYHEAYRGKSISLGVNDFTGLGEVVIVIKKGDSPEQLQTIQTIRIIGAEPVPGR